MKYIYTEEELQQKSQKWLDFRDKSGFGASQIPIILGNYPPQWSSPYELFLEKMGKPKAESHIDTERGNYEDEAREYLTNYYNNCKIRNDNCQFCENVYNRTEKIQVINANFNQYTVIHKDVPNIFASYDGIDLDNKLILEIKCPKEGIFNKLLRNRIPNVPKTYKAQVQMQLYIANSHWGITKGIFAVYHPEGLELKDKVTKNVKLIKLLLIETELDMDYCLDIIKTCNKYFDMVDLRQWKRNWNDKN